MPIDTAILPHSVVYVEHSGPWAKISDPCSKMHCVNKKLIISWVEWAEHILACSDAHMASLGHRKGYVS